MGRWVDRKIPRAEQPKKTNLRREDETEECDGEETDLLVESD